MNDNYRGKNVVITGGSSGIGFAAAELLVNAGARVVITGRSRETL
ncbi:SDR family NAD(P)-dependent oxidoreductase, partial [Saccharomonospora azurea]